MTALEQFERLESLGLWRDVDVSQRVEVVVSFGKASLVLSDKNDRPLTHWSLAAVEEISNDDGTVIYTPDKAGNEILEISDDIMIDAIARIRATIKRPYRNRGRIRLLSAAFTAVCLLVLTVFWLPEALAQYAANAVSPAKAREIGAQMMPMVSKQFGAPCKSPNAGHVIRKLENRLLQSQSTAIFISDLGARYSAHLPGDIILANRILVEEFTSPEVLSGFVLVEKTLSEQTPPLKALFLSAGSWNTLRFLVQGQLNIKALERFAHEHLNGAVIRPRYSELLMHFELAKIPSTPLAETWDSNLTTTQELVDGDPYPTAYDPILTDTEWLMLQQICET